MFLKIQNQKDVWNKIAPEWHENKVRPSRAVKEFLKNSSGKVLDLGSGSGRNLQKIKKGKMYLVDFSEEMIVLACAKAKKLNINAEVEFADLTKLPYENNFFDAAICVSTLHCIKGWFARKKALKELYRVLKPGARAYVGVWNINSKRFKGKRPERLIGWTNKGKRYYYLYNKKEFSRALEKRGFKIVDDKSSELMMNFIVEK